MAKSQNVFVLTREVNEYNQEGAYFVAVFAERPSVGALAEVLKGYNVPGNLMSAIALLERIRNGGGRKDSENEWFVLEAVELKPHG